MTEKQIREAQAEAGLAETQRLIDSGAIWGFEGSMGRAAMAGLEEGVFFLPAKMTRDFYGNKIPNRNELEPGTKGTLENASRYWEKQ